MAEKSEASIIEIIQKMVRDGESEEKIIQSLKTLGVAPDKAKRLLLLGQADTFALLRSEITKIVKQSIEEQRGQTERIIGEEAKKAADENRERLTKAVIADLRQYEKDVTGQSKTFEEQINETVHRVTDLSERVRVKLNELGEAVRTVQLDMDELKLKGVGSRNRYISLLLIVLGIAFAVGDIYLLFTTFGAATTSIDSIIIMVIMAMIAVTMLFVATVI
ncbi:MAG: hypothetical protein QT03_C0001G1164 [archaeon GW2011_AR10]|uniref:Uncharacterized protein n=2 Tax=Candidatus Iainarchaeum sp. TaxID=3101447 RepID=A0A7J4IVE8_9ARCH|nr:MAG: hypothetical protein QT03_C0001G1164 [archaeon GW2011_AR10]HIH08215.1 hypothetical protein [Candidatus Diapherotrites archaeon]